MYIWERKDWPHWKGKEENFSKILLSIHRKQAHLLGSMKALGFTLRDEAHVETLTQEVLRTSEIEGEHLDQATVRSSVARHLGINIGALAPSDRFVDGVVEMILDATTHCHQPLTKQKLFQWHRLLFPADKKIGIGQWRNDAQGPMQVVSGAIGRERVHYEAPPAERVAIEMKQFLTWLHHETSMDPFLIAARAHLWFVTIHPFDDGNGRIARAISDMVLARADENECRCYSLSAQIQRERKNYYQQLEFAQCGSMNDTDWISWFLECLERSIEHAQEKLSVVLEKSHFWNRWAKTSLNERQTLMLNKFLDGFEGNLTSAKWAKISKCSPDAALRDIKELIAHGVLIKEAAGGRSTSYRLRI